MLKAIEFEILRGAEADSRTRIPLAREPVYVASLVSEAMFEDGHFLGLANGVRLEDPTHDWAWRNGQFRYFARVEGKTDVVVVYQAADVPPPMRFDPMTGARLSE